MFQYLRFKIFQFVTEIEEIDVYPPPTHKNISISHAVADNVVKLELRAQNLRDDNRQIDTEISSNDSQISTLQSEVDILEESLNDPGSSGNAEAIGAQITQKQSLNCQSNSTKKYKPAE